VTNHLPPRCKTARLTSLVSDIPALANDGNGWKFGMAKRFVAVLSLLLLRWRYDVQSAKHLLHNERAALCCSEVMERTANQPGKPEHLQRDLQMHAEPNEGTQ
jgi:hypothetical protein